MGVRVRLAALAVVALPVVVSCGSEADPQALLAQECADLVTAEPATQRPAPGVFPR